MRKGVEEIRAAQERAKGRTGRSFSSNYFFWRDGEAKPIRFLTDMDNIYIVGTHSRVECHDGKYRSFACREEADDPGSCELCRIGTPKRDVGYGLAVLREEVMGEKDGIRGVIGYRDYLEEKEVEENGTRTVKPVPWVGYVNQGIRNFWSQIEAVYSKYGSLRDYDIEIRRLGSDLTTTYIPFPLREWMESSKIDNIDTRYKKYTPDLEEYLRHISSQEHYDKMLHGITKEESGFKERFQASNEEVLGDEETELDRLRREQRELAEATKAGSYE